LNDRPKGGGKITFVCGFHDQDLPANRSTSLLRFSHLEFDLRSGRVEQGRDAGRLGNQLVQQPQPLGAQITRGKDDARDVAAGSVEIGNEAGSDRITAAHEHNRYRRGCGHGSPRRKNITDDDGRLAADEIGRQP
jgi:hypothetical protein